MNDLEPLEAIDLPVERVYRRDPAVIEALGHRQEDVAAAQVRRPWTRMTGAPLLMAVGAKIRADAPIPDIEQVLCAGAAVMNMHNALHALGYGGMWLTGAHVYDRAIDEALGFAWPDRLVGLLLTGTPSEEPRQLPRPPRSAHVREWSGSNARLWNS